MSEQLRPASRSSDTFRAAARCGVILGLSILLVGQTPAAAGGTSAWSQAVSSARQGESSQSIRPLQPGAMIERDLGDGETHLYQLPLAAGEYACVAVEPRGVEILTSIVAPGGDKLYQIDDHCTRTVSVIAGQASDRN